MNGKIIKVILVATAVIVGLYFLFFGLAKAQPFLAPLSVAILLTLLMIPVSQKIELWGVPRGWAAFVSVVILLAFFTGLFFVVSAQVKNAAEQWPKMKEKIKPKLEQVQQFIAEHTGMSEEEQQKRVKETLPFGSQESSGNGKSQEQSQSSTQSSSGPGIGSLVAKFFGFLGTTLLTFVYIFFFLLYREKFKRSILRFVPEESNDTARRILEETAKVSQQYLFGKLILIIFLAALYAIGLSISGVNNAILISLLAAVLSLIPYVGNIIGFGLALAMGAFSSGGTGAFVGITVTFAVAQFVESYILEPYIVGEKVNLHPVFTILAVVVGGEVWGIIGMVIGIPLLGIVKVICDHVPLLNPVGYLLGEQQPVDNKGNENFFQKLKGRFRRD